MLSYLTSVVHDEGIRAVFLIISDVFQNIVHVHFKASNAKQSAIEQAWPDNCQYYTCNDPFTNKSMSKWSSYVPLNT